MHFRTELSVNKSLLQLHHKSPFLTIGSCFAEEIGSLLEAGKFDTLNNTFGTTFNPISIAAILRNICQLSDTEAQPLHTGEVWLDYRFHSSIYGYSEQELNQTIEGKLQQAHEQLRKPNAVCILTLGTAWVYRLLEQNKMVANCHKQNKKLFQKELCTPENLLKTMQEALETLFTKFPQCQVILTLSPVRHTRDGLEENQISKSLLRVLCHQLNTQYNNVHYFPAYEIVLDDLRDYRFYAQDLVHPNELAVAYIWDKFRQTFFDKETNSLLDQWQQARQNLRHKPFYEKTQAYKTFLEQTLRDLEQLNQKLNVSQEILELKQTIQRHS
ncbi:MAG: hypothetical protein K0R51_2349 [Cytophagaceae bacterium]|jgi:hypothetical protein|nr:hypothetical protein [Cytophagaceae bacterium]